MHKIHCKLISFLTLPGLLNSALFRGATTHMNLSTVKDITRMAENNLEAYDRYVTKMQIQREVFITGMPICGSFIQYSKPHVIKVTLSAIANAARYQDADRTRNGFDIKTGTEIPLKRSPIGIMKLRLQNITVLLHISMSVSPVVSLSAFVVFQMFVAVVVFPSSVFIVSIESIFLGNLTVPARLKQIYCISNLNCTDPSIAAQSFFFYRLCSVYLAESNTSNGNWTAVECLS